MSVFPFPNVTPNEVEWTLVSNVGTHVAFSGATQTVDRTGERWQAQLTFRNLKDPDARRLRAWASGLNGPQHRFTLHDHSYSISGSITATEMVDVPFNATNWIPQTGGGSLTDTDGGVRFKVGASSGVLLRPTTSVDGISAPTAGLSYAASLSTMDGAMSSSGGAVPTVSLGLRDATAGTVIGDASSASSSGQRHVTQSVAPSSSTMFVRPFVNASSSAGFGSTIDLTGLSVSRCFVCDSGVNALTYSEAIDNAAWTKTRTTVVANSVSAPDGATTVDEVVEDSTAASTHSITQSATRVSAAEFWTGSIFLKSGTSRRVRLWVDDGAGNGGSAVFDSTSGAITDSPSAAGTGSNAVATIHDIGDDWHRCRLSVLLPATTTARMIVEMCDGASNTTLFDGDGSSFIRVWGAQLQRGGQLGRYTPTTTTATTGTAQTGKRIWVKALDSSTEGQLLPGDRVEIGGQVVMLTSQLDGDASGIGLLECTPRVRTSLSDEAPVVLYKPSGKFMLGNDVSWRTRPGGFTDVTINCVEDIA